MKNINQLYSQDDIILQQLVGELKPQIRQQLAGELQNVDNEENLIRYQLASELEMHPVFQIPWFHHVQIFTQCKSIQEALFYVQKTIENGWSRAVLMH